MSMLKRLVAFTSILILAGSVSVGFAGEKAHSITKKEAIAMGVPMKIKLSKEKLDKAVKIIKTVKPVKAKTTVNVGNEKVQEVTK